MGTYSTKAFEKALEKKGFIKDKTHHNMFWLYCEGKKTSVYTKTSHSEKEFNDFLLSQRCKQIKLNKQQFIDFLNCPLTEENYLQILKSNGKIR